MAEAMDRAGFAGGKGDQAVVTLTDNGNGLDILVVTSFPVSGGEAGENAVEGALDVIFQGGFRLDWRKLRRTEEAAN